MSHGKWANITLSCRPLIIEATLSKQSSPPKNIFVRNTSPPSTFIYWSGVSTNFKLNCSCGVRDPQYISLICIKHQTKCIWNAVRSRIGYCPTPRTSTQNTLAWQWRYRTGIYLSWENIAMIRKMNIQDTFWIKKFVDFVIHIYHQMAWICWFVISFCIDWSHDKSAWTLEVFRAKQTLERVNERGVSSWKKQAESLALHAQIIALLSKRPKWGKNDNCHTNHLQYFKK